LGAVVETLAARANPVAFAIGGVPKKVKGAAVAMSAPNDIAEIGKELGNCY